MTCCPYLKTSGKMCGCKLTGGAVMCEKHFSKQSGGSLMNLNYPIGRTVGLATIQLMDLNNAFAKSYYSNKKGGKKSK